MKEDLFVYKDIYDYLLRLPLLLRGDDVWHSHHLWFLRTLADVPAQLPRGGGGHGFRRSTQ